MKIFLRLAARSLSCLALVVALVTSAHAAVTNVAWYRLGENDPGAVSGPVVNSATIDFVGGKNLRRFGSPRYTNAVSRAAADRLGSTLAVLFNGANQFYSNAVITTARNNFGIEAWVQPATATPGTYLIVHNGNTAANGWGFNLDVGTFGTAAFSAEFGGGVTFGSGATVASRGAHVALVRDSGTSTFYVNGVASGSTSTVTPATPAGGFAIAATPQSPQFGFFPGIIDEVRVFIFGAGQFSTDDLLVNQQRVATLEATGLTTTSATLNGSASSFTFATSVWFEWGTTASLGNVTPPQALGSSFATTNFSEVLTGLTAGLTHYFRAVATNDLGTAFGNIQSFIIGPSVETLPASALGQTTATLNGVANPNGTNTIAWFEWGFTTNYGNVTPPQPLGGGNTPINFSDAIAGLLPSVSYHFRAVASNSFGVVFGADQTFQTFGPLVTTLPPSAVTPTTATLNGLINPRGTNTSGWFEWGLTTNYGNVTPPQALGSANGPTNFSEALTGLIPGVSYHFRAVASNALGVVFGADQRSPRFDPPDYFKASNTGIQDNFGTAVAMSGDTLVVGASGESSNASGVNGAQNNNSLQSAGAAYVFVRNGDSWSQQAYLKASNPGVFDSFGQSVAISGDTIVVGAPGEDSNATGVNGVGTDPDVFFEAGAAYVFVRTGTNWSQQAYLKAADAVGVCTTAGCTGGCSCAPGDSFGASVAVSGDTVVVGAPFDDSSATGVNGNVADNSTTNSGAAYVFVRNGTNWTQQAYLKASNTGEFDSFGNAVTVSGDTVVVGASGEDSNATTVNGDQGNNSAADAGAAYVFVRNGTSWTQQAYLKAANAQSDDRFGTSIGVADDTVVVGAVQEDSTATGVNGDASNNGIRDAGAAYVFHRNGANWTQSAYLKASNTDKTEQSDFFGTSVAISGNLIVVGARNEDSSATGVNGDGRFNTEINSGAAYAYEFNGTTWAFLAYLKASNTEGLPPPSIGDNFGQAVAVADGFVAAGAPFESSSATGINGDQDNNDVLYAGAVYVFRPTPPPAPEIDVSESNADIANGGSSPLFAIVGTNTATRTFVIRNSGNDFLTGLTLTFGGPDTASFAVTTNPVSPVFPTSNTTFTVRFTPTRAGTNTATLRLASNDADENPFTILLNGLSLSFTEDRDGDGLNDATELLLAPLGFNFQVPQTGLVNLLFSNANGAGLFTTAQVQALNVDAPLISKDPNTSVFKLTIGVQKATLLTNFVPFPMTAPQTTINGQGKLEFQFSSPDNAAFFRLEAR